MDYRRTTASGYLPHAYPYSAQPEPAASHAAQSAARQPDATTNHSRSNNTITLESDGHPQTERNNAFLLRLFNQARDCNLFNPVAVPAYSDTQFFTARVVVEGHTDCVLTWARDKGRPDAPATLFYQDNIITDPISAKALKSFVKPVPTPYPEVASLAEPHAAPGHWQSPGFAPEAGAYAAPEHGMSDSHSLMRSHQPAGAGPGPGSSRLPPLNASHPKGMGEAGSSRPAADRGAYRGEGEPGGRRAQKARQPSSSQPQGSRPRTLAQQARSPGFSPGAAGFEDDLSRALHESRLPTSHRQGEMASAGAGSSAAGASSQAGQTGGIHDDRRHSFDKLKFEVLSSVQRAKRDRKGKRAINKLTKGVELLNEKEKVKIRLEDAKSEYIELASSKNPMPADVTEQQRLSNLRTANARGMATPGEYARTSLEARAKRLGISDTALRGRYKENTATKKGTTVQLMDADYHQKRKKKEADKS